MRGARTPNDDGHVVVTVDCDPHVELLVRQQVPSAHLVAASDDENLNRLLQRTPDLVIVELASPRLDHVLLYRDEIPILGVGQPGTRGWQEHELGALLLRPFDTTEFRRTLSRMLGAKTADQESVGARIQRVMPWALMATATSGAVVELVSAPSTAVSLAVAMTFVYTVVRLRFLRARVGGASSDVVLATALLALTGGPDSGFTLHALAVAWTAGAFLPPLRSAVAGAILGIPMVLWLLATGDATLASLPAAASLFVWPAVASSALVRLHGGVHHSERIAHAAGAHRTLMSLREQLRDAPAVLSSRELAADLAARAHRETGGAGAMVLLEAAGYLREASRSGLDETQKVVIDLETSGWSWRSRPVGALEQLTVPPVELRHIAPSGSSWVATTLEVDNVPLGVLLMVLPELPDRRRQRRLRALAHESALLLDTAQQTRQLCQLWGDAQRADLADQLRDGLAQTLVYVRFELEMLARQATAGSPLGAAEIEQLVEIVADAGKEVRATVAALTDGSRDADLGQALRTYVQQLTTTFDDRISVNLLTDTRVGGELARTVFTVVRTVVRAALVDPGLSSLELALEDRADTLEVTIRADGGTLLRGVPWDSLQRRLEPVNASLEVLDLGATRSAVRISLVPRHSPAPS